MLSFSSQPLQRGAALGPPAVVQVEKTEHQGIHCLIVVAACGAKGYIPAKRNASLTSCLQMSKQKTMEFWALVLSSTPESRNYPLLPGSREELIFLALNNLVAKALKEAN